ncbi:MAG: hypothetical protein NTU76_03425 [Candidatus Taylorbacteria bacterium]|nr:hypothetical protein [Candidatus Taylorbacteria bacterium]
MKKDFKKRIKLTQKDYDRMWGEVGPYSQVNIKEQIRILDDSISRVFLVVEAEINPFTFEYVKKGREQFINDEAVLQLLDYAEYRGKFGYVVGAGEVELSDEESRKFAKKQADATTRTLIRMHKFVMEELKLRKENKFGVIKDEGPLVWNDKMGSIEVDSELWDSETLIGGPAGILNNKMRYYIVLAHSKKFTFKSASARIFAVTLKKISTDFKIDVEECESFMEYALMTVLIPFDIAPSDFIDTVINESNKENNIPIFQKDYFMTNVKRPTPEQITTFLKQLPLDKDIQMKGKEVNHH